MSRLTEVMSQKLESHLNLGPTLDLGIKPEQLLPHRSSEISGQAPLSQPIMTAIDRVALHEHIWQGSDRLAVGQAALSKLIGASRKTEKRFLGFDMVRRNGGATGFEGYGAGYFTTALDMAEAIAKLGAGILAETKTRHDQAGDHLFINRLWKFIAQDIFDPQIANFMHITLAATIARLKTETAGDGPVDEVRQTVNGLAKNLTPITYDPNLENRCVDQNYILPQPLLVQEKLAKIIPVETINPNTFAGRPEYWGYLLMLKLGIFGHSFLRAAMYQEMLNQKWVRE